MAEKSYTIRITEKEWKNPEVKRLLVSLIEIRLKLQRHNPHMIVSMVEYNIIRHHRTWRHVQDYLPKEADRLKGEVGKYNGKRVVVRGMK